MKRYLFAGYKNTQAENLNTDLFTNKYCNKFKMNIVLKNKVKQWYGLRKEKKNAIFKLFNTIKYMDH